MSKSYFTLSNEFKHEDLNTDSAEFNLSQTHTHNPQDLQKKNEHKIDLLLNKQKLT